MSFSSAPPVPSPAPQGSGISCYLRIGKRGSSFTTHFSAAMQDRIFGGPIRDQSFAMEVGRGSDEGKLRIVRLGPNLAIDGPMFIARSSVRGGASIKSGVWDLLPKDKRPGSAVELLSYDNNSCVLKLPSWARPSARDGQLGQEFALKPAPRAPATADQGKQSRLQEQAAAMGRAVK